MTAWTQCVRWAMGAVCLAAAGAVLAAPPIEAWTQPGGAQVRLVTLTTLPMIDIQVDFDGGSRRDPSDQAGLAAATAWMLDRGIGAAAGADALDENQVAEAWSDLGAEWSAQATADRFSVRLRMLSRPALSSRAVELAARQLTTPMFPATVWQRERERLVAGWRQAQTRPDVLAERAFEAAVYGNHPYGYAPQPDTWARIGADDLRAFYRRHVRACDARVTLVGDVTRSQAERWVDQLLRGLAAHGCEPLPVVADVQPLTQSVSLTPAFPVAQAQILVGQPGFRRDDPDFLALILANHILGGGGFTSRLMQEIREKRGLTYGIGSTFSPGRHAGAFVVSMQTRPDQAREAVDLIHAELARFVREGPTEAELKEAKQSLINGFALRLDSNRKLLDNVASMNWNGLPLNYLDTWQAQMAAVTREQLMAAVQRVLQPDRMVTVVLGGSAR